MRKPPVPASIGVVAALLSVAAPLRIAATFGGGTTLIPAAAAAWTLAFLLLGAIYLRLVRAG